MAGKTYPGPFMTDSRVLLADGTSINPHDPTRCESTETKQCGDRGRFCKHAIELIRSRRDRLPVFDAVVLVPLVSKPIVTAELIIARSDGGHVSVSRKLFDPVSHEVIGFVGPNACRLDLRDLIMPYAINDAMNRRCHGCNKLLWVNPQPEVGQSVVLGLAICDIANKKGGLCRDCRTDAELIPDV